MNSGSVSGQCRSFRDYKAIYERAEMIMLDHQLSLLVLPNLGAMSESQGRRRAAIRQSRRRFAGHG